MRSTKYNEIINLFCYSLLCKTVASTIFEHEEEYIVDTIHLYLTNFTAYIFEQIVNKVDHNITSMKN